MDLSTWDPEHYRCSTSMLFKMKIGGRCHRCEYCRNNFVSFRPAKYKFVRKQKAQAAQDALKKSTLR